MEEKPQGITSCGLANLQPLTRNSQPVTFRPASTSFSLRCARARVGRMYREIEFGNYPGPRCGNVPPQALRRDSSRSLQIWQLPEDSDSRATTRQSPRL